jgi:hypothetical protein
MYKRTESAFTVLLFVRSLVSAWVKKVCFGGSVSDPNQFNQDLNPELLQKSVKGDLVDSWYRYTN